MVAADGRSINQPHTVWYGNITGTGTARHAPQAVRLWLGRIGVEIRSWSASFLLLLLLLSSSLLSISSLHPLLSSISLDFWQSCLHIHVAQSHGQFSSVLLPRYFIANYHPSSPPRPVHTVQLLLCGCFFSLAFSPSALLTRDSLYPAYALFMYVDAPSF